MRVSPELTRRRYRRCGRWSRDSRELQLALAHRLVHALVRTQCIEVSRPGDGHDIGQRVLSLFACHWPCVSCITTTDARSEDERTGEQTQGPLPHQLHEMHAVWLKFRDQIGPMHASYHPNENGAQVTAPSLFGWAHPPW